jgi:hypothetical protein
MELHFYQYLCNMHAKPGKQSSKLGKRRSHTAPLSVLLRDEQKLAHVDGSALLALLVRLARDLGQPEGLLGVLFELLARKLVEGGEGAAKELAIHIISSE